MKAVTDALQVFDITGELPTGTTLLEASAGTGKTWTIASLVTRYVVEGVATLDEMLVVTFGRAASQELRDRVREQLTAAARLLANPPDDRSTVDAPLQPLADLLLDVEAGELDRRRRRLRRALADFDAATIATTHQFCQLVLASLGVAGDTDASARLVEDLDDVLAEVVDDLYVRGFAIAAQDTTPEFTRAEAMRIAHAAVGDPQARLTTDEPPSPVMERRLRFAEAVRAELDRRKRRLGVLSYDDLLQQLADALAGDDSPARDRMRQRWSLVLVDEFQDTDPVQWQVLDRAFSGHATLVLIGDPKQAIYAFRGGDVVTYLEAAGSADTHATLSTNHRSDAPLVEALDAMLGGAALGSDQITVRPVTASHRGSRLLHAPQSAPIRVRVFDRQALPELDRHGSVPAARVREAVAEDLASDILRLLGSGATFDGKPLERKDIAVLCATNNQCAVVQERLRRRGIPSVVGGSGNVFASEGGRAWLVLLEAMERPSSMSRARAAALTPFFGIGAAQLDAGGDPLTDTVAERLRDWLELFRTRGVAAVFEAASASGELAARVLAVTGGERLMTDLRHAAEALHRVERSEGLGLAALTAWARQQLTEVEGTVATERSRRLDSDAAAVQILTVHGSKGLQFPVVYLPSACDRNVLRQHFPRYHDPSGLRCRDVGGGSAHRVGVSRALAEEAGENLRLLYVGLTRAQSQVVTWWLPNSSNTPPSALHRLLFGRSPGESDVADKVAVPGDDRVGERLQLWCDAGALTVETAGTALAALASTADPVPPLSVREFTRHVDKDWRRTSYTGLSRTATQAAQTGTPPPTSEVEDPPRDDDFDAPATDLAEVPSSTAVRSPMADLPVGATFGSLVHAVLEHADPAAPERGGDVRTELLHHIAEQRVRWPVDLPADALADALVAVLDTPLGPLAPTTLRAVGRADRMCELAFELPLGGGDDRAAARLGYGDLPALSGILRQHLPAGDPLLPFAEVVDSPAFEAPLRGYLTGSLDVVLRVGGRYLVADYKTNWLGGRPDDLTSDDYLPERLAEAMAGSTYPLQAMLYAVVLHRFLRWRVPDYDPDEHLGGVLYLYVRGMCGPQTPTIDGHPCGVFSWRPPTSLVEAVSDLLDGRGAGRRAS